MIAALLLAQAAHSARVASHSGMVEYRAAAGGDWRRITSAIQHLAPGSEVRTGPKGAAEIHTDSGSRVRLAASSAFRIEEESAGKTFLNLVVGRIRTWVKRRSGSFKVRTLTAACAVRGTEFSIEVDPRTQATQVDLFRGTLQVSDNLGNELVLEEGRRLSVTKDGMGAPQEISKVLENELNEGRAALSREVGLAMSKEAVLAAAAEEMKLAEYQQGKSLVDVFGKRVQLEEYIMRPADDQFKLVVLNKREEQLDYFFYHGTFNTALPADLGQALAQVSGTPGVPDWYLTSYRTGRSNTVDSVEENAWDGHPVDVNSNADSSDDITSYFNSATNSYETVSGSFYKTLFDYYTIKYNGTQTYAWTPVSANVQSYMSSAITTSIYGGNSNYDIDTSLPDGTYLHHRIKETYGAAGDVYTQYDNYIFDNDGNVAELDDFAGAASGPQYKERLLDWNFQQVITSSFFGDRKIDLVVEPKILIQSGLVQ